MDKRELLETRPYTTKDGRSFTAKIYRKSNNRGLSMRIVYGEVEIYAGDYIPLSMIDRFVQTTVPKYPQRIVNRPFMVDGVYAYILGKKRYFTNNPAHKNDEEYFYVPSNVKDPITRYKAMFLKYLIPRVIEIGKTMGRDFSEWTIRTGLFLSYFAVCFPTKHQLKFDYRLFAYKPEISDSVIVHEISHTYEFHHNERFYRIVKLYCPNYDELDDEINCGRFEGRMDDYVYERNSVKR